MEEMRQHKLAQLIKSAEGSAGLLHKIMKPTAWRGRNADLEEEDDARLSGSESGGQALEK